MIKNAQNLLPISIICLVTLFICSCKPDVKQNEEIIIQKRKDKHIPFKNMLGINAFEWDFLQDPEAPNDIDKIHPNQMALIKSFTQVRHYLDWEKLENTEGSYTYNPTNRGGWNLDLIYEECKKDSILVVTCIKNVPDWLYNTYPTSQRGNENIPAPYKHHREKPASYIAQAKMAFQFAARYGNNKKINKALLSVNSKPRWTGDSTNKIRVGLDLIKYVECNNEPDKWWKGVQSKQTPREYAANLSAFYDGDKGRLGKNTGIKNADSTMKVVIGGLAKADINYIKEMVAWCKENRGLNADGSINLCFDVINYHLYSNDNTGWFAKFVNKDRGVAPELTVMGDIADTFVDYASTLKNIEVWSTELGYDLKEQSVQRAIAIGSKSVEVTQGDWAIRSALLYARHGVDRLFFYQLFDTDAPGANSGGPFGASGLVARTKRRPAANYFLQLNKLMGDYIYDSTTNLDPIVDVYKNGNKTMYVLVIPDEKGRTEDFELILKGAKKAEVYTLNPFSSKINKKTATVKEGILETTVTETPKIIEVLN